MALPVQLDFVGLRDIAVLLEYQVILVQWDHQEEVVRKECLDLQAAQACIVESVIEKMYSKLQDQEQD